MRNAMQLKALVNNYAVENRLIPQIVLQNYHLQRFVERLVRSKYRKKFVIKGGLLLSALYGLDRRTTMDIDATVTGIAAGRELLAKAVGDICAIDVDDGIDFSLVGISDIAANLAVAAKSGDACLMPATVSTSRYSFAAVSGVMFNPVREGTLYRIRGLSLASAMTSYIRIRPFWVALL